MKIAHISDVHFCKERADEALASLYFLENYIKENPVDMTAIAGDLFEAAVLNSENARLAEFAGAIKRLGDLAPVAMVYGTPSHDVDGSLEIFKTLTCNYGITVLDAGQAYFATVDLADTKKLNIIPEAEGKGYYKKALILGIPEPRKKYLLAGNSAGKGETEEAIRDAMHRMCFLLAAKRREYLDIPCVVLYHGEVAGCVLQNDKTVERGSGIAITVDDLADIGADYYALGHIHKPQQVGTLPAYYAGSIYPKNFGETHQAGFNVVEIGTGNPYGFPARVDRVTFPHPQNMKIETSDLMFHGIPDEGITGKRVWLEITCTREQRALINAETTLQWLLDNGACRGSRVTVCDIPVETVRAAEITAVTAPAKKFEVWAENSNIEYGEALLKKIESLEAEILKGTIRAAGEWELVSVKLRGAVGIKKGTGRDETALNFDDYDNGLIALVGANGRGKQTG